MPTFSNIVQLFEFGGFSVWTNERTRYRAYREVGGQFFPEDGDLVVSGLCMDTHTWVERISKNTLAQIESFQEKHKCPTVPLRQEWMREGTLLLAGKKIHKTAPKCIRTFAEVGNRQFVYACFSVHSDACATTSIGGPGRASEVRATNRAANFFVRPLVCSLDRAPKRSLFSTTKTTKRSNLMPSTAS